MMSKFLVWRIKFMLVIIALVLPSKVSIMCQVLCWTLLWCRENSLSVENYVLSIAHLQGYLILLRWQLFCNSADWR